MPSEIYIVGGINGFQAYSTKIVTDALYRELKNLGHICHLLILKPRQVNNPLARLILETLYRYIIYPLWCRKNIPDDATVYITDHANAGVVLFLKNSCKTFVHVHDLTSLRPIKDFPYPVHWKNRLIHLLSLLFKKPGIKKADQLIAISEFTANELHSCLGINKNKIIIAHNGINHEDFWPEDTTTVREALNIPGDTFIVMTVGPASYRKNYIVIAKALNELQESIDDIIWIHIGELEKTTKNFLAQHTPSITMHCLKRIDNDTLRKYYSAATIFISSSLYEGFGLPPVEALACGTSVVASDIPAHKEILQDKAIFFPRNNDAALSLVLRKAYLHPEKNLSKCLSTWSKNIYSWHQTAKKISTVLK